MAPVETHEKLSLLPLATAGSHIILAVSLTLLVSRTIFRSYLALPPSQATRRREESRRTHVKVFSILAVLSLVYAGYWKSSFSALSYRVWAAERGIALPESFFGEKGAFRGGEHPGRLHVTRWLNDTPVYFDALEIVAEKARRAWWGDQIDLATVSWGLLLAIEGRRRKIPHLWAFMALSQLLSLSFAQNLFFLAMLLTPVPLPDNIRDLTKSTITGTSSSLSSLKDMLVLVKPDSWCPHPILYLIPLILSLTCIFLSPFASNTPSFMTVASAHRVLSFAPLLLPYVVPESWGTIHTHPHNAHSAYTTVFRTISIASALLHGKSTLLALLSNTPDSYYHRHSLLHPFRQEHRTVMERSSTAVGRVLGAIADHPAVSAVGWDVILSGLSTGLWAASRGLEVQDILAASGLTPSGKQRATIEAVKGTKSIVGEIGETAEKSIEKVNALQTPGKRRPGRPKKSEDLDSLDGSTTSVSKRRGRPRKISDGDSTYQPTEVVLEEGDMDQDEEWEVGALVWGLMSVTGLGTGSAGVFGAETTAR